MNIYYKVKGSERVGKWSKHVRNNKDRYFCDMCHCLLWINPEGHVCCSTEHTQEQIMGEAVDKKVLANDK